MEQWLDIPGYEGLYRISDQGNVFSIFKMGLKKLITQQGYKTVSLCKDGKQRAHRVHRLVGLAFIPNPDIKPFINHIDGIKDNNNVANLEWCTPSDNTVHAVTTGLLKPAKGEDHVFAAFKDSEVLEIRRLLKEGETLKVLAKQFNSKIPSIAAIRQGLNYKHLNFKQLDNPSDKMEIVDQHGTIYESQTAAAEQLGLQLSKINLVIHGHRNHTGGYKFKKLKGEK